MADPRLEFAYDTSFLEFGVGRLSAGTGLLSSPDIMSCNMQDVHLED